MKLITFHRKNVNVSYKNALCSWASVFYLFITILSILAPLYLVLLLTPKAWLETVQIWEQPNVQFKFQYYIMGQRTEDGKTVACSSFPFQRQMIEMAKDNNNTVECSSIKIMEDDHEHDGKSDEISFTLKTPGEMKKLSLQLFFDVKLKKFCEFHNIPTVLLFDTESTTNTQISQNIFYFGLHLTQKVSFNCPILFRHQETLFRPLNLTSYSMEDYTSLSIYKKITRNPGHFKFELQKSFKDYSMDDNSFKIIMKVPEVMIRFETPLWHKIFNVWVKFVSIYILFFFAAKYLKDYVFGNYWIRSWEVIPWKKIY